MKSALTVHQELLGNYQEYLSKQFKSSLGPVTTGRNQLYDTKGVTFQPPFLEFLFNYKGSGKNFSESGSADELSSFFGRQEAADNFRELASKGLVPYELYLHQWEMLKRVLLDGKHAIITTGTGSGKTESFMLPLMAYLAKQTLGYGNPNYRTTVAHDGCNNPLFSPQDDGVFRRGFSATRPWLRKGETRTAAVKAIMLFPMNALVEDQLKRIRNAFSNPNVLDVLDSRFNGNRIFYGKYNGMTAGTGKLAEAADYDRVKNYYVEVAKNEFAVIDYANNEELDDRKRYTEALDYFGREVTEDGSRLTGEMLNRFDMQQNPPDILITNFSMLNIMLTRSLEQGIWDKTAEWLEEEGAVFHVVLDEMHLYRGSAGTEIAYSISALLQRLGIADNPDKVRFLASSASLDMENDQERVNQFIGGFFNLPSNDVPLRFHLEKGENDFPVAENEGLVATQVQLMLIQLNDGKILSDENLQSIAKSRAVVQLCDWYRDQNGSNNRPCSLDAFGQKLFQVFSVQYQEYDIANLSKANPDQTDLFKLANGFFLFREALAKRKEENRDLDDNSLPRIRFHLMYNNFEGLWGSISASANNGLSVNATYNFPKKIDADRNKVYQLFYCEKCESSFVGGYKNPESSWQIPGDAPPGNAAYYSIKVSPSETSLTTDSRSVVSTDTNQLKYFNYCIFWPENQLNGNTYRQHIPETNPRDRILEQELSSDGNIGTMAHGYWVRAFFNPANGEIRVPRNRNVACPKGFILGRVYISLMDNAGDDIYTQAGGLFTTLFTNGFLQNQSHSQESALSQCCPCCATKKLLTPIVRGYRTGFNKTNQLFASGLFKSLKGYNSLLEGKLPKLVSFSDSRDEAAQVSAGVEAEHFNELVSNYILSRLAGRIYDRSEKEEIIRTMCDNSILGQIADNIGAAVFCFDEIIDQRFNQAQTIRRLLAFQDEVDIDPNDFDKLNRLFTDYKDRILPRTSFSPNELVGNFVYGERFSHLHEYLVKMGVDVRGVYNVNPFIDMQNGIRWHDKIQRNAGGGLNFFGGDNQIHLRYSNSHKYLKSYLLRMMFQRTQYSIEAMGLGKLEPQFPIINGLTPLEHKSFIYGLVKLMGWKGKYRPRILNVKRKEYDETHIQAAANLPDYIRSYVDKFNLVKGTNVTYPAVLQLFIGRRPILDFQDGNPPVRIHRVELDETFVCCPQCYEVYSQITSHCMNCGKEFKDGGDYSIMQVQEIRSRSYAGSHLANMKNVHRLHCEELSGQTDDPFGRQRNFLGLIKDENIQKLAQEIDLLAVTTTLEVGVDIGSLQGMLMANMPPQRFNYQQRVGRVGRRGQAFSFAVTLCRSKSHDAHYFQHPEEITGNPSPTPFLNITQNEILERVLNKYFLTYFFRGFREYLVQNAVGYNFEEDLSEKNINGEFGKVRNMLPNDDDPNRTSYLSYLQDFKAEQQRDLHEAYDSLVQSLKRQGSQFNKTFAVYETALFNRIWQIIEGSPRESSIGEVLMENGLLPSYGMPTKVALFYNNYPRPDFNNLSDNAPDSMDRTIDVAIFDYSPGTVKLKDKVEFTVKAIVPRVIRRREPPNNFIWATDGSDTRSKRVVYQCQYDNCDWFDLEPTNQEEDYPPKQCPKCNQPDSLQKSEFIAIEPRNFSVKPNDTQSVDRRDVSSNNRLAISRLGNFNWGDPGQTFGNICMSYKMPEEGEYIYKINKGSAGSIPLIPGQVIWGQRGNVSGLVMPQDGTQSPSQYWLFTRKNTDTLSFIVKDFYTQRFDLRARNDVQSSLTLKAVFLSAATILQRCFAHILDIDPREIEFANPEIATVNINGELSQTFQVTFYDSHDNGSGYVKRIKERMIAEATDLHGFITTSEYYNTIVSTDHKSSCRSGSCYKCIRTYENSMLHGLLDWRLGLNLIRFMGNPDYRIDFEEFADYVLSTLSNPGYGVEVVVDNDGNSAVTVKLDGTPKYIVTHPIARFDTSSFKAENDAFKDSEAIDFYQLMLIS